METASYEDPIDGPAYQQGDYQGENYAYDDYLQLLAQEEQFSNLTDWQWDMISGFTYEGQQCMLNFWNNPYPEGVHCNSSWDGFNCWPTTPANTTVYMPCPRRLKNIDFNATGLKGYRHCNNTGHWSQGNWTNYSVCMLRLFLEINKMYTDGVDQPSWQDIRDAQLLASIYFYGALLSVLLLTVTFFIFAYFKTLQCNRISIHKNLVVSFILRFTVVIVIYEPYISNSHVSYRSVDWLCKVLTALFHYSTIANIFWMFVEGLFLHNRVAVSVFSTEAPFRIFYVVGWGLPGLIIFLWSTCMHFYNPRKCWNGYFHMAYMWIILTPIIFALLVNIVFLVNIIRILITKLRANNTLEADQVRKAVKATAVLFPLLGMSNILFFVEPMKGGASEMAYRVTNAICQSSQGIFVSVIYCFMNSEVRAAIVKKWQRYKAQKMGTHRELQPCNSQVLKDMAVWLGARSGANANGQSRMTSRECSLTDTASLAAVSCTNDIKTSNRKNAANSKNKKSKNSKKPVARVIRAEDLVPKSRKGSNPRHSLPTDDRIGVTYV